MCLCGAGREECLCPSLSLTHTYIKSVIQDACSCLGQVIFGVCWSSSHLSPLYPLSCPLCFKGHAELSVTVGWCGQCPFKHCSISTYRWLNKNRALILSPNIPLSEPGAVLLTCQCDLSSFPLQEHHMRPPQLSEQLFFVWCHLWTHSAQESEKTCCPHNTHTHALHVCR